MESAAEFAEAMRCFGRAMPLRSLSVADLRRAVSGWPFDDTRNVIAEEGGRVVGLVSVGNVSTGDGVAQVAVDPAWRGRGIGSALAEALLDALPADPAVSVFVDGDDDAAVAFARRRGFELEGGRPPIEWYIDLEAGTAPPAMAVPEGVAFASLTLDDLGDLDGPVVAELLDGHAEAAGDETGGECSYENAAELVADYEQRLRDGGACIVARDHDGTVVGATMADRADGVTAAFVWLTFVRRSHQGRGIASALKIELHRWAVANGVRWLHTFVFLENDAMRAVQRRIGWQPSKLGLARRAGSAPT